MGRQPVRDKLVIGLVEFDEYDRVGAGHNPTQIINQFMPLIVVDLRLLRKGQPGDLLLLTLAAQLTHRPPAIRLFVCVLSL